MAALPSDRLRAAGRRKHKAFTLVELLVVVAIIVLLVSILLPSLRGALEVSRQGVCLMNLHRTYGAWINCATERFDGHIVPTQGPEGSWHCLLRTELGDPSWSGYWCPSTQDSKPAGPSFGSCTPDNAMTISHDWFDAAINWYARYVANYNLHNSWFISNPDAWDELHRYLPYNRGGAGLTALERIRNSETLIIVTEAARAEHIAGSYLPDQYDYQNGNGMGTTGGWSNIFTDTDGPNPGVFPRHAGTDAHVMTLSGAGARYSADYLCSSDCHTNAHMWSPETN